MILYIILILIVSTLTYLLVQIKRTRSQLIKMGGIMGIHQSLISYLSTMPKAKLSIIETSLKISITGNYHTELNNKEISYHWDVFTITGKDLIIKFTFTDGTKTKERKYFKYRIGMKNSDILYQMQEGINHKPLAVWFSDDFIPLEL